MNKNMDAHSESMSFIDITDPVLALNMCFEIGCVGYIVPESRVYHCHRHQYVKLFREATGLYSDHLFRYP